MWTKDLNWKSWSALLAWVKACCITGTFQNDEDRSAWFQNNSFSYEVPSRSRARILVHAYRDQDKMTGYPAPKRKVRSNGRYAGQKERFTIYPPDSINPAGRFLSVIPWNIGIIKGDLS